jgi:hypothetical protein
MYIHIIYINILYDWVIVYVILLEVTTVLSWGCWEWFHGDHGNEQRLLVLWEPMLNVLAFLLETGDEPQLCCQWRLCPFISYIFLVPQVLGLLKSSKFHQYHNYIYMLYKYIYVCIFNNYIIYNTYFIYKVYMSLKLPKCKHLGLHPISFRSCLLRCSVAIANNSRLFVDSRRALAETSFGKSFECWESHSSHAMVKTWDWFVVFLSSHEMAMLLFSYHV